MKKLLSAIVTISIVSVLIFHIVSNWSQLMSVNWNVGVMLIPFVVSLITVYGINILSWHYLLLFMYESLSFRNNAIVWLLSNITRLLPGGIWQYPSRVVLLQKNGVSKYKGIYAVFFELIFTLLSGVALVFALLWRQLPQEAYHYRQILVALFCIPFIVLLSFVNPLVQKFIVTTLNTLSKRFPKVVLEFNPSYFLHVVLLFILRFLVIGTSLYFLITLVYPITLRELPTIIGMYSLSWLMGYIVIFAPGGLGVTEGVLTLLLSYLIPSALAATIAIVFRILLLLTEVILVIITKTFLVSPKSKKM